MDRRTYLTALGAAAAAVSGCSEGDGTETATRTSTTDGTPTPTERATATAQQPDPTPSVTNAGLLLDKGEYTSLGDIDSVGQGAHSSSGSSTTCRPAGAVRADSSKRACSTTRGLVSTPTPER
ncbi:hypothetical protein ACFQER_09510 [Halomicroarcula sp. GCM10025894]|uniref:hypothetical protein n=1 Tax=Halomicroarcula sp. GCM10025894 TaxID=3252673 RepID=UPI003614C278